MTITSRRRGLGAPAGGSYSSALTRNSSGFRCQRLQDDRKSSCSSGGRRVNAKDVAPLLNSERACISGVLGSAADVGNVPNPLGDEFLLMPHATPHSAYPTGFIRRGAEVTLREDGGERWSVDTTDYGAHEPRGLEKLAVEFEGAQHEGAWAVSGRILSVRIAKHGCDVPIRGGDDPATVAHQIAHEMLLAYRDIDNSAESEAT